MATKPRFATIQGGKTGGSDRKKPPRSILGARIRDHRNAAGLSQKALAEKVNVKAPYICEIETGAKIPSDKLCFAIAEKLGVEPVEYVELARKEREKHAPEEIRGLLSGFKTAKARYDEETERFLDDYRSLDAPGQKMIRDLVKRMRIYLSGGEES